MGMYLAGKRYSHISFLIGGETGIPLNTASGIVLYILFAQEKFQQGVEEQLTVLGDLPVLLALGEVALRQGLVELRADHAFIQPREQRELRTRRGFQQTKAVHKELERLICGFHIVLALKVATLHIPAWVARFRGT